MPKVVVFGEVEDLSKWEEGFRTHGDLFKSQTVKSPIQFSTKEGNQVVAMFDVSDLDTYQKILDSPATAEAMAYDGFKRETMKLFILDKEFNL